MAIPNSEAEGKYQKIKDKLIAMRDYNLYGYSWRKWERRRQNRQIRKHWRSHLQTIIHSPVEDENDLDKLQRVQKLYRHKWRN